MPEQSLSAEVAATAAARPRGYSWATQHLFSERRANSSKNLRGPREKFLIYSLADTFLALFYCGGCMKLIHACIALSLVGAISSASVTAQQPAPPKGDAVRAQAPEPVTGEILSVDDKARTIVVKASGDTEMKFSYSPE